jgi:hypothetical protein
VPQQCGFPPEIDWQVEQMMDHSFHMGFAAHLADSAAQRFAVLSAAWVEQTILQA